MVFNGIDLVEISKFDSLLNDKAFIDKVFNKEEMDYINKHYAAQTMAGLYASKEAMLKAMKKGINNYSLKDVLILHEDSGAPYIVLQGDIQRDYKLDNISLSISHDGLYAIAIVTYIN